MTQSIQFTFNNTKIKRLIKKNIYILKRRIVGYNNILYSKEISNLLFFFLNEEFGIPTYHMVLNYCNFI